MNLPRGSVSLVSLALGLMLAGVTACTEDGGGASTEATASGSGSFLSGEPGLQTAGSPGSGGTAGRSGVAGDGPLDGSGGRGGTGSLVTCSGAQLPCDGACIDPSSDADHCGACGNSCLATEVCDDGSCIDQSQGCSAGRSACERSCVDLSTNPAHCGECSSVCPADANCSNSACNCPQGREHCGDACVDTLQDAAHCGGCDRACASGEVCNGGECECPGQESLCSGECVDTSSDVGNCGRCGAACTGGRVCNDGECECAPEQRVCGTECVDVTSNPEHCGACGTSCGATQVCRDGVCGCTEEQSICGEDCADLMTDALHCGDCGEACAGEQECRGGECACPEGNTACGDACVDTLTDPEHCGDCGAACGTGFSCEQGECTCPADREVCGEACADLLSDGMNCGDCGVECELGRACSEGECVGQGVGTDGCGWFAEGVQIEEVAAYQTVEVPLVRNGEPVADGVARLIAGRDTLLRVFVTVEPGWQARELAARLHLESGSERQTLLADRVMVSGDSQRSDRGSTFEFLVSRELMTSQARYVVEVVDCAESAAEPPGVRYPTEDSAELGAEAAGGIRVHIIPLRANNRVPPTDAESLREYADGFLAAYPVDSVAFTVGEEFEIENAGAWTSNLDALAGLREDEEPDDDVYYYGMLRSEDSFEDFCGFGCTTGIGYIPYYPLGRYSADARVALGVAFGGDSSVETMLHEVGHNHGRLHAPCAPPGGSIGDIDPDYPYPGAEIGVYGYDIRNDRLIAPDFTDLMGYCNENWISDYNYAALTEVVISLNQTALSEFVAPEVVGAFRVLLTDSAWGTRWGRTLADPTVPSGIPEPAEILDQAGNVIDQVTVYRTAMSALDGFSIQVPEPEAGWYAVKVIGVPPIAY